MNTTYSRGLRFGTLQALTVEEVAKYKVAGDTDILCRRALPGHTVSKLFKGSLLPAPEGAGQRALRGSF